MGSPLHLCRCSLARRVFLVSARVLELGVHMVCIVWDNPVSRFINGSTPVYVLYGACMAGIFEECGRYVVIRFLMKKNKNRESMVMYGIGHGGAEVWAISLMSIVSLLAVAIMLQGQGIEGTLPFLGVTGDSPESMAGPVAAVISSAANFGAVSGVLAVLERMGAMAVHISLTVVVAYGIVKGQRRYLPLAILAHAAGDLLPALYQRGAVYTGHRAVAVALGNSADDLGEEAVPEEGEPHFLTWRQPCLSCRHK